MILPLLEQAGRRATQADATEKSDETTRIVLVGDYPVRAEVARSRGVNLRVIREDRVGYAGAAGSDEARLLERALESVAAGEEVELSLPSSEPLTPVVTHMPRAQAATLRELVEPGLLLRDRLAGEHAELRVELERSVGAVRVANTRGVDASYDVSLVVLRLEADRYEGSRRIEVRGQLSGADLPGLEELEQLVAMVRQRLAWASRPAALPPGRVRGLFLPEAVAALLAPVEQALTGKAALDGHSPLAPRRGGRALSGLLTILDDPLLDGRPGSRPIDDEGIPSQRLTLVREGTVERLIHDLETAARIGAPPTGHGRRSTFGKPQPAFSNLIIEPGITTWADLLSVTGDGVVFEQLRPSGQANLIGGTFALGTALAWRVEGGEITGIIPEMTVAGNTYDLLARVAAVGDTPMWVGSRCLPPVLVEGVSVF